MTEDTHTSFLFENEDLCMNKCYEKRYARTSHGNDKRLAVALACFNDYCG